MLKWTVPLVLAVMVLGCATAQPGADEFLLRGEQLVSTALETLDALFYIERNHAEEFEMVVPGGHAAVESLRMRAPDVIRGLVRTLDVYRSTRTEEAKYDAIAYIAAVMQLLQETNNYLMKWGTRGVQ